MKVPSGWLYKLRDLDGYGNVVWESDHVTFVPNQKKRPRVKIEVVR